MEKQENLNIAGRKYDPSGHDRSVFLPSALATTHEQVKDAYVEGTVDGIIDDGSGGEGAPLSRQHNE
ncbi:YozQ family protein [Parageobacillus thermoglucosidasius]|uniref:YozQ family protein n=1 Tax=Parageobacillus thermoglucosidasius TaxID=1426 RepID=UPI000E1A083B|nr:YozQ family protein [Parageobacillus thermoglucosidasius]RDE23696.1 DUF4025 domain-containing protein [Parageobacillus thermoglucosidasius]